MARRPPDNPSPEEPHHSALAEQLRARGFTAAPPPPAPTPAPAPGGIDLAKMGKLVVRRERKGRGGKTVTLISGLGLPPARLEELARTLRKALGCGSTIEDGVIVLLGDVVPRVQAWLQAHGAQKIVLGS